MQMNYPNATFIVLRKIVYVTMIGNPFSGSSVFTSSFVLERVTFRILFCTFVYYVSRSLPPPVQHNETRVPRTSPHKSTNETGRNKKMMTRETRPQHSSTKSPLEALFFIISCYLGVKYNDGKHGTYINMKQDS